MVEEEKYKFWLVNTNTRLISPGMEWMSARQAQIDNERLARTVGPHLFYSQTPEEVLRLLDAQTNPMG